jgi:hypothetical protein
MITEKTVSTKVYDVRMNGSYRTRNPSFLSMEIDHYLAAEAAKFHMDSNKGYEHEGNLKGFKLIAIFDDGKEEPEIQLSFPKHRVPEETDIAEDDGEPEEM